MPNPLYNAFGHNNQHNNNGISQLIGRVKEIQRTFSGNPKDEVQRLLDTGAMSQQQFNQYSQMANNILSIMRRN